MIEFVPIIGDFIAQDEARRQAKKSVAERQRLADELYGSLQAPEYEQLTSAATDFRPDTQAVGAQREALRRLMALGTRGGLSAQDVARLRTIRQQQQSDERAQRLALENQARMRGTAGSGTLLASQLAAQQGGANRAAQRGTDIAAAAQQNALRALSMGSGLAGDVRRQGSYEDLSRAQAIDAINRFNRGLIGQGFQDEMQLAGAKHGAYTGVRDARDKAFAADQARAAAMRGMIANSAATLATGMPGAGAVAAGQMPGAGGAGAGQAPIPPPSQDPYRWGG